MYFIYIMYYFCSCKSSQIHVHIVLWTVYNKYCLTVCSKNDITYLFQMLYFLPYIVYLCMHGQIFHGFCWKRIWITRNYTECFLMMLLFDWVVGRADCVMHPLKLDTGLNYKGDISLIVWITFWDYEAMYTTESNVKTCTCIHYTTGLCVTIQRFTLLNK